MKIAISAEDKDANSQVSEMFARCKYFIVAEIEDGEMKQAETLENENIKKTSGAGVAVAQMIAGKGIEAVIAGNIGPRALDVLKQFNIKAYSSQGVIKDVVQEYIDGKLKSI